VKFPLVLALTAAALTACARDAAPEPAVDGPAVAPPPARPAAEAAPAAVPLPPNAPRVEPGPVEPLEVATARGPVRFQVEIADSPAEAQQGLMWRGSMPADRGMLFDMLAAHGGVGPQAFWMKNTYIPLDIIYIGEDGRIVSIAKNTQPLSEASIPSGAPARAVLEINAGLSDRLGIAPGDRVRHRIFP
jgi:uncharacterized membrane protein (UPF0127 family)